MSLVLDHATVLFRQRVLRAAGLYLGALDGLYGPRTSAADDAWDDAHAALERADGVKYDDRTVRNLRTLLPAAHAAARRCLLALTTAGLRVRVLSGTRTYPEQDALYRVGRRGVKGERWVTRARAGSSNHNFGIAWDLGLFAADGKYLVEHSDYGRIGMCASPTVEWGGTWSFPDRPHLQLVTSLPLSEVRRRFEAGEPYVPKNS